MWIFQEGQRESMLAAEHNNRYLFT